ncbi:hypothetical protein [uncultured Sphingomonas sp.]|uniref:hypothetical protein n=1 Tax=uncultured Sphingomonas sp. TaxID=158754 RepID=UPI0035CC2E0E
MITDKFDLLGPAYADIGREAARLAGGQTNIFLYVEIGDGWVGPSLFKDEGATLRYIDPITMALSDLLMDAWCL